ncbi:hypothetical protein [Rhizobium leguminosarum]|uniref:hypothetical protein n=1 Tax=Rhizobium leguminosarum TaxID=384 RepID=UPI001C9241F5|nr:hypothetical protein [Rhizobium leguminosarum]
MSMQIRGIAIYSRSGEKRETRFKLDSLNVVTGASKTGKSALLDIVDFCWGRDECTVPRGEIRNGVSWFAVLFDRAGEGILVAGIIRARQVMTATKSILNAMSKPFPRRQPDSSRT